MDWFAGVAEEELLYYSSLGNELDSLFAVVGSFVPPPPRPPFLPEETVPTDGLTTCDLCSWALRNDRYSFSLDGTLEAPGEIGWVLTLIIVSLISAGIGAVVMVTLLHCRRMKSAGGRANCCGVALERATGERHRHHRHHHHHHHQDVGGNPGGGSVGPNVGLAVIPDRPPLELDKLPPYHDVAPNTGHNVNVWSWLGSRRGGGPPGCVGTPLSLPQHRRALNLPVENHYTHMQTDEALYAELDSQAASYASGSEDKHYHELDAVGLHRQHQDTLCTRHSQRCIEPDYEMYENGSTTVIPPPHLHHHHLHHHHHYEESKQQQPQPPAPAPAQPSYQNTGYTGSDAEPDGPSTLSSAPSSAYYSDLSSNSANQQLMIGPGLAIVHPEGDAPPVYEPAPHYRLTAINESTTCPSDYI
ncbi:uncharacterized protein LOC100679830 isoform X2 [Nasonia vitripennis]|nr:uncharacterized protein LOC100679830 isoform X2 [Nasonia vitripennis]